MTKELQPLISIIIPAFNAQASIERAVSSVLKQTYRSIELIVINDCSSDKTSELLRGFPSKSIKITVIENKTNRGVAAARNQGIDAANGDWVTFLDADDYFNHTYLEKVHNFLRHQEFVLLRQLPDLFRQKFQQFHKYKFFAYMYLYYS